MPKTSKSKDEHEKSHKSSSHSTKSHTKTKSHSSDKSHEHHKKVEHHVADESKNIDKNEHNEAKSMTLNPDMMEDQNKDTPEVKPEINEPDLSSEPVHSQNSTKGINSLDEDIANEISLGSNQSNVTSNISEPLTSVKTESTATQEAEHHNTTETPSNVDKAEVSQNHQFNHSSQPHTKVSPFLTQSPTADTSTLETDPKTTNPVQNDVLSGVAVASATVATGKVVNSTPIATTSSVSEPVSLQNPTNNPSISEPADVNVEQNKTSGLNLGIGIKDNSNADDNFPSDNSSSNKYKKMIIFILLLLLFVVFGGYVYLNYFATGSIISPMPVEGSEQNNTGNTGNQQTGKDYENPINGLQFSNSEADGFKNRKPIAVMVNNYVEARPSSGLSQADIVYEAVAEGGITRLMPIFFSRIPESVSSIRSARYYFVELASAYKPHYIHWGAAHVPACQKLPVTDPGACPPVKGQVETEPDTDAYTRIQQLGVANLDGGNYPQCDTCAFGRDPNKVGKIPLEHTAFVRLPEVYNLAKEVRKEDSWHQFQEITKWSFKEDAAESERGDVGISTPISYQYWTTMPSFDVKWEYDKGKNVYKRFQGGVKQTDASNNQDLEAKVVIVRFTKQTPVGDKKNHLYHDIVGSGEALIFQDGTAKKAKWSRFSHEDRDIYVDESGSPIQFNRGQVWVQLVPTGNPVNYQASAPATAPTPAQ